VKERAEGVWADAGNEVIAPATISTNTKLNAIGLNLMRNYRD
jgi:hypothetical protein